MISILILVIDGWGTACEISFRWMTLDLSDNKSTVIQVMAWLMYPTENVYVRPIESDLQLKDVATAKLLNYIQLVLNSFDKF